jgi:hypothetical protein
MSFEEPADEQYEPVTGKDAQTVKCVRACEAEASAKTASDYEHVVWAYGVIWALFCGFGVLLWTRSKRQQADLEELKRRLAAK